MGGRSPPLPAFLVVVVFFFSLVKYELTGISYSTAASIATVGRCHASERKALVELRRRLVIDPSSHRLTSWIGDDCCAWEGVGCSNITGHVLKLDLRNRRSCAYPHEMPSDDSGCKSEGLGGEISESLLSLRHLRHLDLSANAFQRKSIPELLGSLRSLTYLNLSGAGFIGKVPDRLGNLSLLRSLDLSYNSYYDHDDNTFSTLYLRDAGWISRLTSLRHLSMNSVSFANASNWLGALNVLPLLQTLELSDCELARFPQYSFPHANFTSLKTLDLSSNDGLNSSLPEWLFNITTLEHLDLGGTPFYWLGVPSSIAELTSLRTLDLTQNVFQDGIKTAGALSNLCKLQSLILSSVPLDDEMINLRAVFSKSCLELTLEELDLSGTQLRGLLPDWLGGMKNLTYLDLSRNSLYGSLPASLGSLPWLQYLDVNNNDLNGTISMGTVEQMDELIYLDISDNSLSLAHFANLPSLEYWYASSNNLSGVILRDMLGHMKGLAELYLDGNSLMLSEEHLASLSSLQVLDISQNTLVFDEGSQDWIPPFQLSYLYMSSCKIRPKPQIPKWISTQIALSELDMSSSGIQGSIPDWLPTSLRYLSLSNNQMVGHLPYYLPNIESLYLSNNSFSGQLYPRIAKIMPNLTLLDLSMNNLSGGISSSFCHLKFLKMIHVSTNRLWGSELPDCWKNSSYLQIMDTSNNSLRGEIPRSLCNTRWLDILHLHNNNLSGKIPRCLERCRMLETLDLSYNQLTGNVPAWIGESLTWLQRLNLRSNALSGSIPSQLSNLQHLHILDLSSNNLSGTIPPSFGNITFLRDGVVNVLSEDYLWLSIKGSESEYQHDMLNLVKVIDLSYNRLTGHIPEELGDLHGLQSLNLSKNYLTGEIPGSFEGLQKLEILDLSSNSLSGVIPPDLAALTFLNHLNLSYNNLSGKIPIGSQLQTFDSSSYIGNPNLCGFPLSKNCTDRKAKGDREEHEEDDAKHGIDIICLYASISFGFIVGFWVFCGTLILKRGWRFSYFRRIDNVYDNIYVAVAVKLAKFTKE